MFQNANATVRTVSNNTNSPGQYTTLQAACDAASANDTIYVHASETIYSNVVIRKPLVIIGEGSLPNEQMLLSVIISGLQISASNPPSLETGAGSKFYGLQLEGNLMIGTNNSGIPLGSLTFERCKISSINLSGASAAHSNLIFHQCVLGGISSSGPWSGISNSIISNSIISGVIYMSSSYGSNNILRNCLYGGYSFNGRGFIFSNSIFYNPTSTYTNNSVNSTYTNNLLYYQSNPTITNGTTTATGNVFADPMFITPEMPSTVLGYNYNSTGTFANFNLQAGSPAMTLGTDGTQAGLYGGTTPWIDGTGGGVFRYNTMPKQVPFVIDMNILNNTIPVNGTLNVQINARTQD